MKTLILGLGNTIMKDDGAGIYVVREIQRLYDATVTQTNLTTPAQFREASTGGFNFIDTLAGYNRVVIIDAIHTKDGKPGKYYELDPACLKPSARLSSLHGIDFATACYMANKMKVEFPSEIKIFVIEAEDEFSFGETCTDKVDRAIPHMAIDILKSLSNEGWI